MNHTFRTTGWAATVAAILLAGCASGVKLNEVPIESRTPNAVSATPTSGTGGASGTSSSSTGSGTAQSQVAAVDLTKATGASSMATAGRIVYFDFDSYIVKDEFRGLVDAHSRTLVANQGKRMLVEGHTDERGGREYNLALGQRRAEAVAKSMQLLGVGPAQVEPVSFGKERPANDGNDEAAWARNRRAELKDR